MEFQPRKMKKTFGFPGNNVTTDTIKVDDILASWNWGIFSLVQFIVKITQKLFKIFRPFKIKPKHLVDVPGHSRLRLKLDEYMSQAAGIIFAIDFLEFLPNCCSTAEYLYNILTKASAVKKRIPVLIVRNKTEKSTAHSKDFIRKQLEKEIEVRFDVINSTRVTFYPP